LREVIILTIFRLLLAASTAVSNSFDKRPDYGSKQLVTIRVSCQVSSTSSYGFTVRGGDESDRCRPIGIASVRPRGPAAEAGLLPGDQLVAVNGLDVIGCSAASASAIIRQTALTSGSVTLGVVRNKNRHFDRTEDGSTLHLQDTGYHTLQQSRDLSGDGKQLPEDELSLSIDVSSDRQEDDDASTLNDARLESHVYDSLDDVTGAPSLVTSDDWSPSRDVNCRLSNDVNNNDSNNSKHAGRLRKTAAAACGQFENVDDVTAMLTASPVSSFSKL
jgi:membrane-associated protease RseP (regulator of RpoE activity)